jgi:hypothetical protein
MARISPQVEGRLKESKKGAENQVMRIRNHEINQRRQRQEKRRRLRRKLAAATTEEQRQAIQEKIRKTYPKYTAQV